MNRQLHRRAAWLVAAVGLFAAFAAWADGELDTTFGPDGVAKITFPNSTRGYLYGAQTLANGTIEAFGFEQPSAPPTSTSTPPNIFVATVSAAGMVTTSNSFSQAPAAAVNGPGGMSIASRDGDFFIVGSNIGADGLLRATAVWMSPAGRVHAYYTRPATSTGDQSQCRDSRPILDAQRRLVVACAYGDSNGPLQLAALRLIPRVTAYKGTKTYNLAADVSFGPHGFSIVANFPTGYSFARGTAITQDPSTGAYYVAGFACNSNCANASTNGPVAQVVARLNGADGRLDTTYGNGGFAIALQPMATGGSPESIDLDQSGNAVLGGHYSTVGAPAGTGYVARVTAAGTTDSSFGSGGVALNVAGNEVVDVRTEAVGRIYALDRATGLHRLTANGTVDASFISPTDAQTLNGPGSVWQSMQYTNIYKFSAYLVGGVGAACTSSCATSAVIAKITLVTSHSTTSLASSLNPSTDGIPVTFTATVSGTSPAGTVTFKDGVTTVGTVAVANGSASFTINSLSVGNHLMTALYGGDPNNGGSQSPALTQTVKAVTALATTTDLTVTPNTLMLGQSVTLTATVAGTPGGPVPTGSVLFLDGTTPLNTVLLAADGTATLSTDVLDAGGHGITAKYSGDASSNPSLSSTIAVTVSQAASAAVLTLTPSTTTEGQSVTLTATVTGVPGGTPTGTVTFKDGMTALGTGMLLADGTVTFSTSALTVGAHSLAVDYGGDANYTPSTSAVVTVTVNTKALPPPPPPSGGGGGSLGMLDLCALLLLALRQMTRPRPRSRVHASVVIGHREPRLGAIVQSTASRLTTKRAPWWYE
jgi:hypothetical protein